MPDTPKLHPYAVAMLFGQDGRVDLGLGIVGALNREHASAHAVLKHLREHDITAPLMGVAVMEITNETVRMMFNSMTGQKAGEVTRLRPIPNGTITFPDILPHASDDPPEGDAA